MPSRARALGRDRGAGRARAKRIAPVHRVDEARDGAERRGLARRRWRRAARRPRPARRRRRGRGARPRCRSRRSGPRSRARRAHALPASVSSARPHRLRRRRRRRGMPRRPADRGAPRPAVPRAITLPNSSTKMRSQIVQHEPHVVVDEQRRGARVRDLPEPLAELLALARCRARPRARRGRGAAARIAIARATPTSLRWPCVSSTGIASASRAEVEQLERLRRALAPPRPSSDELRRQRRNEGRSAATRGSRAR